MKCLGWVHLLSIPSAKSSFCLQGKKQGIFIHPATGEQVNLDLDTYKAGKEGCSLKCTLVLGHACEHLMTLATNGNHDIAKFHPHEKTTKYWQEEMAAGGTFPLPPTDEEIELLSDCFQPEKRMPGVIKNKTGRKPRRKSAHERAVDNKTKIAQSRRRRAVAACKPRPNKKKKK